MVANFEKLASGLFFLSSDAIAPFHTLLLIPGTVSGAILPQLRKSLEPRLDRGFIGACDVDRDAQLVGILTELETSVGYEALTLCLDWIDEVYPLGSDDGTEEIKWIHVFPASKNHNFRPTIESKIVRAITEFWQEYSEERRTLRARMKNGFPASPSDWDARLQPGMYSDWSDVDAEIAVIVTYNLFRRRWDESFSSFTVEELREVLRWGQEAMQFRGAELAPLRFPGTWRFGRRYRESE